MNQPITHYLGLPDAKLQPTPATSLTGGYLTDILTVGGILSISGSAGLGKTVATTVNLNDLAPDTHRTLPTRPGMSLRDYRLTLASTFTVEPTPDNVAGLSLENHIQDTTRTQPLVLFVDEVHHLSNVVLASLATLWDLCQPHLALVLVGNDHSRRRLRNVTRLASRIEYWQRYKPLTHNQVRELMPRFHPQWASVSPDDLIWCDDAVCRGNFRDWARLTRKLVLKNQQRENPPHTFTRALAREAIQEFSASDVWAEPEF
ncbi:AAA family ATPase [Streptomyces albidoflavus]|uniref:ORC1/DEAH AAA+ ATPase domain-containing protein n=1 Tax=Streptomyces tremellae TaxID=1124239 RepID=A0ABP7FU82_9ACTN|nr:ATP-binding protein [Streptomyces sp. B29(2018)]